MLALKHRPATFSQMVGQTSARLILQALSHSGDVPSSLLFEGPSGTGKTSAARIFAASLNCSSRSNGDCCGICATCVSIQEGSSLSVHEVDAASRGGVDDIRGLQELAQFSPDGQWRVIILDEAQSLSRFAFNALLKILEEPPSHTVFLLLTTEPGKIIDTVRSRSMPIPFRSISANHIFLRLQEVCEEEDIDFGTDVLTEIARLSGGHLRDAVMLLDQCSRVGVGTVSGVREFTGRTDHPQRVIQALFNQEHNQARTLAQEYLEAHTFLDFLSSLIEEVQERFLRDLIPADKMITATKVLWDARSIQGQSREVELQMEAMITLLFAIFRPVEKPVTVRIPPKPILEKEKSPESVESRVGIEELAELVGG